MQSSKSFYDVVAELGALSVAVGGERVGGSAAPAAAASGLSSFHKSPVGKSVSEYLGIDAPPLAWPWPRTSEKLKEDDAGAQYGRIRAAIRALPDPDAVAYPVLDDPSAEAWDEYRACGFQAVPANIWFREKVNNSTARIEYARGGNMVRYRGVHRLGVAVGGERGVVRGFSGKSRHRLLSFMNSVDREKISPERLWFVTLTYPGQWVDDPKVWKRHLEAFRKRMERAYGRMGVVWKMEPQQRGAPHFHLIVVVPSEFCVGLQVQSRYERRGRMVTEWKGGRLSEFRRWCSDAWYEVVGSNDDRHLRAGTNVEPLEEWSKAVAYASKYLGKECGFVDKGTGEVMAVGRFWGIWRRELWPVRLVHVSIDEDIWVRMRRVIRKYMEKQGRRFTGRGVRVPQFQWTGAPRACSAFVPSGMIERLLEKECWWESSLGCSRSVAMIGVENARRREELSSELWLYS